LPFVFLRASWINFFSSFSTASERFPEISSIPEPDEVPSSLR